MKGGHLRHEHPHRPASALGSRGRQAHQPHAADHELEARLEATQRELEQTREQLLRALADHSNLRKQIEREREEAVRFAASRLARDLLDSLDDLRRAVDSTPPGEGAEQLLNGVLATERNLLAALDKHGVHRLDPLGEPFDPNFHEAVYQRYAPNFEDGAVIEVIQPGYMIHDRLLRPATVGVAKNQAAEETPRVNE